MIQLGQPALVPYLWGPWRGRPAAEASQEGMDCPDTMGTVLPQV